MFFVKLFPSYQLKLFPQGLPRLLHKNKEHSPCTILHPLGEYGGVDEDNRVADGDGDVDDIDDDAPGWQRSTDDRGDDPSRSLRRRQGLQSHVHQGRLPQV